RTAGSGVPVPPRFIGVAPPREVGGPHTSKVAGVPERASRLGDTAGEGNAPPRPRYLKNLQNIDPTLRCRPDLVHGMPVARETRRLAFVIPSARFQLKPPLFIAAPL